MRILWNQINFCACVVQIRGHNYCRFTSYDTTNGHQFSVVFVMLYKKCVIFRRIKIILNISFMLVVYFINLFKTRYE